MEAHHKKNQIVSQLVDLSDHQQVLEEVQIITRLISPSFDFKYVIKVFWDVETLFRGEYPGYRACNTEYHDIRHTHQVLLGILRLMHGAFISGIRFSEKEINIGLIGSMMHDTGYIQKSSDETGTGAKYTMIHIQRSIGFIQKYFAGNAYFEDSIPDFTDILNCTGLTTMTPEIKFSSSNVALLGKMLGTADLLGQMSDRLYLEKLLFLYLEFHEAGIKGFTSEFNLLEKTIGFYEMTQKRLADELGGVKDYAIHHFRERWHIDRDLYVDAINNNIEYLKKLLIDHPDDYLSFLRRAELTRKLRELR
ncbi:MAG: hypothetical protein ABIJ52_03465 [Pseudomonadota bacterium]|nr:hypothetical protein [Pseudomonadota bacterium]MBU1569354.1 hypothetical protein [Pseudomonadota bacterium]